MTTSVRFQPVAEYAAKRLRERGDVFGWAPISEEPEIVAALIVDKDAEVESFPSAIGDVRVVLQPITQPEAYSHGRH